MTRDERYLTYLLDKHAALQRKYRSLLVKENWVISILGAVTNNHISPEEGLDKMLQVLEVEYELL